MDEEEIKKKNKELIQKLIEKNKKLEESLRLKPTVGGRIWFYLTCLRPVTKIELAHTAQSIIQNRRLLNQMALQMNGLTLKMSEVVGYLHGKENLDLPKDTINDVKKVDKKRVGKENTGMYM